jgi:hypothetical protein
VSTPGDVTRLSYHAQTASIALFLAERRLPAPSAVTAVNDAQRDFIASCCAVADAYRSITPGDIPPGWRHAERKAS